MRLSALFLLSGMLLAQAPQTPEPAPRTIESVGSMKDLMLDVIYPTSDQIFYVSRDEKKTEKDWIALRQNALTLAESANLLMADNRARDKGVWMTDARLLWEVGNKAYKDAKARDLDGLEGLNAELYEACQSCHVHYRPGYRRKP